MVATQRDLDLLTLVGLTRGATTVQLARVFFPNEDRARRRLRSLFDAGLLHVTLTSSTSPNLVTLARPGRDLLLASRPALRERVEPSRPLAPHAVRHHLLVVELRLWLILLKRQGVVGRLVVETPPGDLASWRRHHLIPDAVADLDVGGQGRLIALEADRGTEAAVVLEDKLARYVGALREGVADGLVIGVEGDLPELRRVAGIARRTGLGRGVAVVSTEALRTGDPTALRAALAHLHGIP